MRTAGNREQGSGNRGRHGIAAVGRCGTKGCFNRVWAGRDYCEDCEGYLSALRKMYALPDRRESRAAVAFFHACSAVRRRLWIPMLVFVFAGIMALGAAWAPVVAEWMVDGGLPL